MIAIRESVTGVRGRVGSEPGVRLLGMSDRVPSPHEVEPQATTGQGTGEYILNPVEGILAGVPMSGWVGLGEVVGLGEDAIAGRSSRVGLGDI